MVSPLLDKTGPSVFAAIDTALRTVGGVPTYLLTDNEKTVTVEHVAGIAVRNPAMVAFGRHYGLTVATCLPADPASKGGSEATVRVAKADLVPTQANLLDAYGSFAELETACAQFTEQVNARVGALADWLAHPGAATATAYDKHFAGHPTREAAAWMLDHIADRIGGLLDDDRGQP